MLDADGTGLLARAAGETLKEVRLADPRFALLDFGGCPGGGFGAVQQAPLGLQNHFLWVQSQTDHVGRTDVSAASALNTSVDVQDVFGREVGELEHAEVIVIAQRSHRAGCFRSEEHCDRAEHEMQVLRVWNDHQHPEQR